MFCAHAVTPPDRVGVIRRLRVGATLVKEGTGYVIDLTKFKHKTSKFYGPVKTSVSKLITPYLDVSLRRQTHSACCLAFEFDCSDC